MLLGPGLLYTAAFVAVPLVLLVVYSTLTAKRFGDVGRPFTPENFAKLGEPVYRSVLFTSVRLALIATLLALLIGYPTAYAIAGCRGAGGRSPWSPSCCRSGPTS